jgi:GcrA cell cycle regulator
MTTWTDDETTTLTNLWQKASAMQIAERLGRPRAAVCAKANRLRREGQLPTTVRKDYQVKPARTPTPAPPRQPSPGILPEMPPPQVDDKPVMWPCSLLKLDDTRCHWPLEDPERVLFCGGDALEHCPYCAYHRRMARGQNRRRTA